MKKLIVGFVSVGFFAVPALTFAAYMRAGSSVSLSPGTVTPGNAYLAGGSVNVGNTIGGDLTVAGGNVIVTGKVAGDINAAGGTVNIIGSSAQDVRVGGGNVTIGGKFSGEMLVGGGQVIVLPDTTIANDSYLAGGTLTFAGAENGNLTIQGGEVSIDGMVAGNLTIKATKSVTIGSNAVIKKGFEYTAPAQAVVETGAQVPANIVFHMLAQNQPARPAFPGMLFAFFTGWLIIKFFIILAAAYLLWYLRRKDSLDIVSIAKSRFWHELLRGFIVLIVVPAAIVIAFITVIGAIPGFVALLAYIAILVLAPPFTILFVASLLKKDHEALAWYHILLGALLVSIVGFIPFIGWLACLIVYLATLGALAGILAAKFRDRT
jgi:hypothetical protein